MKVNELPWQFYYEETNHSFDNKGNTKTILVARSSTGRIAYLVRYCLVYVLGKVLRKRK